MKPEDGNAGDASCDEHPMQRDLRELVQTINVFDAMPDFVVWNGVEFRLDHASKRYVRVEGEGE